MRACAVLPRSGTVTARPAHQGCSGMVAFNQAGKTDSCVQDHLPPHVFWHHMDPQATAQNCVASGARAPLEEEKKGEIEIVQTTQGREILKANSHSFKERNTSPNSSVDVTFPVWQSLTLGLRKHQVKAGFGSQSYGIAGKPHAVPKELVLRLGRNNPAHAAPDTLGSSRIKPGLASCHLPLRISKV